jgi:hypothetical protein
MLDPAPRMALDPEFGLAAFGRTAKDVGIVEDLYEHTIEVILRAEALGGWRALDDKHVFDIEYWDLEQAKLKKAGSPPVFSGEVAVVTGAASARPARRLFSGAERRSSAWIVTSRSRLSGSVPITVG